jgi:biopolymer transport protein TolR
VTESGRRAGKRRRSALSEINVTPLVDVMLVLLIIFMVTVPALMQDIAVNIPKSTVGQAEVEEGIVVTITRDDAVHIDRERVAYADFASRFAAARARIGERPVFLRADSEVPYRRVVEVVSRIKESGIEKLGLVVELADEKPKRRR